MAKFYTLSHAAGLVRSNKFHDKADAVCVGSFRAESTSYPVKIFEHDDAGDRKCVLVCNPDGSVEKPKAMGHKPIDTSGSHEGGVPNESGAHILFASYQDKPLTTFYLKAEVSEQAARAIEQSCGVELGLYDPQTLHAYTDSSDKLKEIESKLSEAKIEIDRISDASIGNVTTASVEQVMAARKAHQAARDSRMPELKVRATVKFGSAFKFSAHCEMVKQSGDKSPRVAVYVDGTKIGEAKNEREAGNMMAEEAERALGKFLKKEL
jgi:hypothetical protein